MATKTCPYCAEEIQADAVRCKHCGTWLSAPAEMPPAQCAGMAPTRLARSSGDRMVAGVCGGIGRYLGVDTTLVRVAYALVSFFTALVPGVIVYLILALVIPGEDSLTG